MEIEFVFGSLSAEQEVGQQHADGSVVAQGGVEVRDVLAFGDVGFEGRPPRIHTWNGKGSQLRNIPRIVEVEKLGRMLEVGIPSCLNALLKADKVMIQNKAASLVKKSGTSCSSVVLSSREKDD